MKKGTGIKSLLTAAVILVLTLLVLGRSGIWPRGMETPVSAPEKGATMSVTDFLGRRVETPVKAERLGCLYAVSGHVVTMLGRGEKIVAVVDGLKRDVLLTEMCPSIRSAVVPQLSGAVNIEELIKARPDVVFIRTETARNEGEMEKLKKTGIPCLVVDYRNIREQQAAIEMIGQVVGAGDKARRYNDYYQRCIDLVQARVAGIPEKERVRVFHSINEATRTDTRDTLPADWMRVAGAVNVSVEDNLRLYEGKYYASLEQIMLWDPEVILVNEPGVADYIMGSSQWSKLRAVKNRRVLQMPIGISRWGHPGSLETPLAIMWTAKTLYPERFTDLDMVAETRKFYAEFFDYPISEEVALQVLSGQGMRVAKGENRGLED